MDGPARTAELFGGNCWGRMSIDDLLDGRWPALTAPNVTGSTRAISPLCPVIKMSGNPDGYEKRKDFIDIYVGSVIEAGETIDQAGERLLQEIVSVASGQKQTIYEKGAYEEPLLIQIDGPSL